MTGERTIEQVELQPLPEGFQAAVITDCSDPNAAIRQGLRVGALFGGITPKFAGLGRHDPDLEAAGQLVDALDGFSTPKALPDSPGVVLVNVAPRGSDVKKKYPNGTPFCWAKVGDVLVLSTYEGRALSLAHKLGLISTVHLLDTVEVARHLVEQGWLASHEAEKITDTQFRSLEFSPLVARLLAGGHELPAEEVEPRSDISVTNRAWLVDGFGNVKTTILPEEIDYQEGRTVKVRNTSRWWRGAGEKEITCYRHLADVPTGAFGLTLGSSAGHRWLEVAVQKGRAADKLGIKVGHQVLAAA